VKISGLRFFFLGADSVGCSASGSGLVLTSGAVSSTVGVSTFVSAASSSAGKQLFFYHCRAVSISI
jgi:hypothetical protein